MNRKAHDEVRGLNLACIVLTVFVSVFMMLKVNLPPSLPSEKVAVLVNKANPAELKVLTLDSDAYVRTLEHLVEVLKEGFIGALALMSALSLRMLFLIGSPPQQSISADPAEADNVQCEH